MSQKRNYRQYNKAFKEEAVLLVTEQGYSVADAAKSLGITPSMLYNWKAKYDEQHAGQTISESEREELLRLRKEIKNLRMEKDILKKAATFFAKEMK